MWCLRRMRYEGVDLLLEPSSPIVIFRTTNHREIGAPTAVRVLSYAYICRYRIMAITSAFQADDVGSIPITCSNMPV